MFNDSNLDILGKYKQQFENIFSIVPQLSDIKPSEWAEQNIIIPDKGPLNYDFNPYCRKIIDCFGPYHPARKIAVMKGSQITFSSGVLMPLVGYTIKENPCNCYLMVGTTDLVKPAGVKLDLMIDGAKIRSYISDQSKRKIRNKSGDTDEIKSFPGGYVRIFSATNTKSIAQVDLKLILLDDYEAIKGNSSITGNFLDLIEMRAASNMNDYKLGMISTPLIKSTSNIEPAFLAGNQERYFINCPCCHEPIIIKWVVNEGEVINPLLEIPDVAAGTGGIKYEVNNHGQLVRNSVGYVCYKCAGFFTDKNKQRLIREAEWIPTAIPISDDYYSFHISSLYAPTGMFDWAHYCGKDIEANPANQPRNEYKHMVQVNTCRGETYEPPTESPKATEIMRNKRNYEIGTIPNQMSIKDGNGRIVLLTCGADLNGTMNDARIDYEVVAWSEKGASYSITHGSVGTFIPRENTLKNKVDRVAWTYEPNKPNSVWIEFDRILHQSFKDEEGLYYAISKPGIDFGHLSDMVHAYIDWTIGRYPGNPCVGVRGHKEEKYYAYKNNIALFEIGKARKDDYFLQVGLFKDMAANAMLLKWNEGEETQSPNFMNFPYSANGLYEYENFFEHFESESRQPVETKDGQQMCRWVKKNANVSNHLWDCRIYNMAMREIIMRELQASLNPRPKEFTWTDYVGYVLS